MEKGVNHGETQVRKSLGYISASRYGLDEDELMRILAGDDEYLKFFRETHHWHEIPETVEDGRIVPVIPVIVWSRLHFDLKPYISERSKDGVSLFNFYHRQVGEVVAQRYLTEKYKKSFHLKLAEFFGKHRNENRRVPEYPWELCEAEEWRSLFELLSKDLGLFEKAWKRDKFDVLRYWASTERASKQKAEEDNDPEFTIVKGFKNAIENPETLDSTILWIIGFLLGDTGNPKEASKIREYLIKHFRESGDKYNLSAALGNQGNILYSRGDLDSAMALYKEQQRICEELGDKAGLSRSLGNQGNILYSRGDLDGAMALRKEEQRICEELGDKDGLQASLGNQGVILKDRGDLDSAMALYKQKQRICEEVGDKAGLQNSLGNQGTILYSRGDLDGATALYKQQQRICEELGDKAGLKRSLGNQGIILADRGDLDGAMALYKQQQRICEELYDKVGLARSLGYQGNILYSKGDLDGAMALYKQQQLICEELGDKAGLSKSLAGQGIILKDRGDLDSAMALYKQQQRICEELGDPKGLAISLANQANALMQLGKPKEALVKAEKAYQTTTKYGLNALAGQIKPNLDYIRSQQ
jgi:tetratricopeptide (TPR) repeat protein